MPNCERRGSSGVTRERDMEDEKWRTKLGEMIAEHRELNKLIPLKDKPNWRKPVPKSELWTRSEREELAQIAEEFLKAKQAEHDGN
jgi:hypothetical protein